MRLYRRLYSYFEKDWAIVSFQPVLYLFLFGASIRLTINMTEPPNFNQVFGPGIYGLWLILGMISPLLAALSWFLVVKCSGKWRFRGMVLRFGADAGVFFTILSYHIVVVTTIPPDETRLFSRYIVAATMVFVLVLIFRDFWALHINERKAKIIRNDRKSAVL